MVYLVGVMASLFILFLILSRYNHYKDVSAFLHGVKLKDRYFVKKILNEMMPARNTPKYRVQMNQCFILNTRFDIRDFYLLKLFIMIGGLLFAICVITTNIASRYSDSYDVSKYIACEMTSSDYKSLSNGLKFPNEKNKKAVNEDLHELNSNVQSLNEEKFNSCNREDLYDAVKSVRSAQSSVFKFVDILIITVIFLICWFIPDFIMKKICLFLSSNSFKEYDSLLSVLLISRYYDTQKVIRHLTDSAKFYTNYFREFEVMYESSSSKACDCVLSRREFPSRFKDIVRYISVLDSEGPEALEVLVSARKDQIQDDIVYNQQKIQEKRQKMLTRICTIVFLASMIRVLAVMLYAVK